MHRLLQVTLLIVVALTPNSVVVAIGEQFSYEKVPPTPRVCIEDGCLVGRDLNGLEAGQYDAFLGIPFAKPPVGMLRFRNPVLNDPWNGDYDATWERSRCVQKNYLQLDQTVQGSEDCLYLNVYRPKNINGTLPVMVYIHGGGYFAGSASIGEFGPERLMDTKKVILVVPQYRLGVFGFLSTGDRASPGNYGMKDQVMALKWVQRNIAFMGGDHSLVTILGQSAGGSSVQMHLMSPLSKGLFSRAVSMSGSALAFWHYNLDPLEVAREQATVVGIPAANEISTEQLVDSLRKLEALELARSIDRLKFFYVHHLVTYHPVIERYVDHETFMSEDPRDLWADGRYHQVPYTVGFLPDEGAFVSTTLLTNTSLLNELNENSADYIPRIVAANTSPKGVGMLKDRFFPDGTDKRWLTDENVFRLQNMFSEAYISHAIILSIKQYLSWKSQSPKAPLSVYYFNFKGPFSRSYYYTYTNGDFGICHADDLNYLFRSSALFPDLRLESPEWYMAKTLVDYYIKFAYDGISGPPCTNESCDILEFTNSKDPNLPVKLNLIKGFDEEQFAFWYNIYALQHY